AAAAATEPMAMTDDGTRARWLAAIADALERERDALVAIAVAESGLDDERLHGELTRTTDQLRFFGEVILEGSYLEVIIDHEVADALPRRPDLRRMLRSVGPVAVYAASNFPFAF